MTDLKLHEELLLLSLRPDKGTMAGTYTDLALAAGVLGELISDGHLAVSDDKKATVTLVDGTRTGEAVIDKVIEKVGSARRDAALGTWIQRIAGMRHLRSLVAGQLVERGILVEEDRKVLGIFPTTRYPEANPEPQDDVTERLRNAVLDDVAVDERTCLLLAVASATDLLSRVFSRRELADHKERIEELADDERLGQATRRAVQALQAAIVVAIAASASSAASS